MAWLDSREGCCWEWVDGCGLRVLRGIWLHSGEEVWFESMLMGVA